MSIVIYTKSNCPNCVSAKQLLKSKGLEYEEIDVEADEEALMTLLVHGAARQMPQIFIDGQRIGGIDALRVYMPRILAMKDGMK
jgi:glutaredoxin 3